jgi:hypothetical protein
LLTTSVCLHLGVTRRWISALAFCKQRRPLRGEWKRIQKRSRFENKSGSISFLMFTGETPASDR